MAVSVSTVLAFLAALCLVFLLGKILGKPARWIGRLLINGAAGGLVLYLINLFGGVFGLHAALVAGTLGLPGVALVLLGPVLLSV